MAQNTKINVNQVNYRVFEALIGACLKDYENAFNRLDPSRRVKFSTTISAATLKTHDVLKRQGKTDKELENIKNENIEVRYLRVGKFFEKISYHTPIIEEFKTGFVYQQLDVVGKVWEKTIFEDNDIMSQDLLDKEQIRVEKVSKEREIPIYQQSMRLKDQKEILNDKWWKRILYLDLLNTLMAKGVEYGEALEFIKRAEEEKAVLAKELGESAAQVLEANKIVIRKEMPAPLTNEDKKYKEKIIKMRKKEEKK